jgi:hypothetical protein
LLTVASRAAAAGLGRVLGFAAGPAVTS